MKARPTLFQVERCPCGEPHDNWAAEEPGVLLCQMCWEKECSASWWIAVEPLIPLMQEDAA